MYPGMMAWWKHARQQAEQGAGAGCGPSHCGPRHHSARHGEGWDQAFASGDESDFGGGAFGVRRPLRFLAHKLELDEKQVTELARVLNELKTERAQAAVDNR